MAGEVARPEGACTEYAHERGTTSPAGTIVQRQIRSVNGQFDEAFLDGLPPPPPQAGELTETQRLNNKLAVEAPGNSWLHKDCAVRLASVGGNGVRSRRTTKSFSARRRERDVG